MLVGVGCFSFDLVGNVELFYILKSTLALSHQQKLQQITVYKPDFLIWL